MGIEFGRENELNNQAGMFALWREDTACNLFIMPGVYATSYEAEQAKDYFTNRGHNQTYIVKPFDPEDDTTVISAEERKSIFYYVGCKALDSILGSI